MTRGRMLCLLLALGAGRLLGAEPPYGPSPVIAGIDWNEKSRVQHGRGSDQWPLTWAVDGHMYGAWGDGWGWSEAGSKYSMGVTRIEGKPPNLAGVDLWGIGTGSGMAKPEALVGAGGRLYLYYTIGRSKDDQANTGLAVSTDAGVSWKLGAEKAFPQVPNGFRVRAVAQLGQGNRSPDGYVYVYFGYSRANDLYLARVKKDRILQAGAYEWFGGFSGGKPQWTSDAAGRKAAFADRNGYIWHVGVTYLPGLRRYLLTKPHYEAGADRDAVEGDRNRVAGLGVFDAANPWGPWTTVHYQDRFLDGLFKFTFFIPAKYVAADGKSFWLAWSGYPEYDNINFIEGALRLR